jgi:hypothetical protein
MMRIKKERGEERKVEYKEKRKKFCLKDVRKGV